MDCSCGFLGGVLGYFPPFKTRRYTVLKKLGEENKGGDLNSSPVFVEFPDNKVLFHVCTLEGPSDNFLYVAM